jgi:ABC-type Fe3+/spermidine/putrescine transport system ATPase subunit
MLRVLVDGLVKRYGQVAAVDGASFDLLPGELFSLLGPKGAGKTTLGRLIAGLEVPDQGEIYFNERIVHALPPHERKVGMIFSDFALWPGLTVADNVSFPLKVQGVNKAERRQRSAEVLSRLRIDSLAGKRPEQLSRAQSLRLALARAIVTKPELLILDEPIEPFEPRGREEAWDEIHRVRAELGVTTLLLTRVVPEALANADRLAVMDLGRILQVGPVQDVYNHPADVFVARFLGPTNLLQGQIDSLGNESRREVVVRTPLGRLVAKAGETSLALSAGTPVTISIRPETLSLGPTVQADWNRFPATIERIIFQGDIRQLELRGPGDWPVTARLLQSQSQGLREGQSLTLSVAPEFVTLLPGKFAVAKSNGTE